MVHIIDRVTKKEEMWDKMKNTPLYELRKKNERAGVTDVENLNKDAEKMLAENKLSPNSLSIMAGIYDMVGENIERESYKYFTRKKWEELERQYVHSASFTLPDLVDSLLTRLEKKRITREQLSKERRKYKSCAHRFCLNVFMQRPKVKPNRFCCDDCRKRENLAVKEFERTSKIYAAGTYLPPSAYKELRQAEKDKLYRKYERLFDSEVLAEIRLETEGGDGKRDRVKEERRNRAEQVEKDAKNAEKTVGIVNKTTLSVDESGKGKKPVKKYA
ncbi:hypothetical protein [Bacillus sp. JJ1562]|uniref:hypothetical protein n=1 Tax=Bacillus sp. JJ1562 TaxID=3122960 RepID=UPI003002666E